MLSTFFISKPVCLKWKNYNNNLIYNAHGVEQISHQRANCRYLIYSEVQLSVIRPMLYRRGWNLSLTFPLIAARYGTSETKLSKFGEYSRSMWAYPLSDCTKLSGFMTDSMPISLLQISPTLLGLLRCQFWDFRPSGATRCTDNGEIWRGCHQISLSSLQGWGMGPPKRQILGNLGIQTLDVGVCPVFDS